VINPTLQPKIYKTCHQLITLLSKQEYDGLAKIAKMVISSAQIKAVLVDLNNFTIVHPPDDTLHEYIHVYPLKKKKNEWAVDIALWSAEVGQCDLDLKVRMKDTGKDLCDVVIEDVDAG
jgi:hypothetical protein